MNELFNKSWMYYVDFVLITIMIIMVLWFGIEGYFIKKEIHIIETCQGVPINFSDEYTLILFPNAPNITINWNISNESNEKYK